MVLMMEMDVDITFAIELRMLFKERRRSTRDSTGVLHPVEVGGREGCCCDVRRREKEVVVVLTSRGCSE